MALLATTTVYGDLTVTGDISGNASTASTLETARTITLTGDVTGSVSFNGGSNVSMTTTVTDSSHNHAASNITSGTLAVARGGTGITSNPSLLVNLDSTSAASIFASSPRPGVTGSLGIANGGTNATTAAAALTNLGAVGTVNGTSPITASKSGTTVTVAHANSGVSASTYGPSANATLAFGGTFTVPYVTVNATGHITASGVRTFTMPAKPSSSISFSDSSSNIYLVGTTSTSTSGSLTSVSKASGVYVTGGTNLYATGFYVNSSRDKKENIRYCDRDALSIIMDTQVYDFNYKDDKTKKPKVGIIAEEAPELLVTNDKDGLDSGNAIGLLLLAVQQLTAKIAELQSRLYADNI